MSDDRRVDDIRLGAIELKLDKIQEVLVLLARIDEKQNQYEDFQHIVVVRLEQQSDRIERIDKATVANTTVTSSITKLVWVVGTILAGLVAKVLMT